MISLLPSFSSFLLIKRLDVFFSFSVAILFYSSLIALYSLQQSVHFLFYPIFDFCTLHYIRLERLNLGLGKIGIFLGGKGSEGRDWKEFLKLGRSYRIGHLTFLLLLLFPFFLFPQLGCSFSLLFELLFESFDTSFFFFIL